MEDPYWKERFDFMCALEMRDRVRAGACLLAYCNLDRELVDECCLAATVEGEDPGYLVMVAKAFVRAVLRDLN